MKKITMSALHTQHGERTLLIPGGWTAVVPSVTPDPASLRAFVRYLREEGLTEWAAESGALATIQGVFEGGYLRGIRNMLYARAREYADRYPDLVGEDGELLGFDPEALQQAYFPFDRTGRRGKQFVEAALADMAEAARLRKERE
jgi:ABC-type glycerol-3-phosphate transport system substrate-binding protein